MVFYFYNIHSYYNNTYSQGRTKWQLYKISDTIPIKKGTSEKVFKAMLKWFETERGSKLVKYSKDAMQIENKGYFVYYNHVVVEDIFLSPRANERTNGNIVFEISLSIKDSIVIAEFSNFVHDAFYSEFGKINFGTLTDYESVPPGICSENKIWCNKVYENMKERSRIEVEGRLSRLVPESMIRDKGKAFKVDKPKEEQPVDSVEKDPMDYLKIENYLIKE